jgi:hypothetical protein
VKPFYFLQSKILFYSFFCRNRKICKRVIFGKPFLGGQIIINEDPHTFISFISPNGDGLKVVIKIDIDSSADNQTVIRYHLAFWHQLKNYYLDCYGLQIDKACKNVDRLCFLPWDEDIYVNEDSEVFCLTEPLEAEPEPVKVNPEQVITDFEKKINM